MMSYFKWKLFVLLLITSSVGSEESDESSTKGGDGEKDKEKMRISNLKVVKENVSGDKFSSFSEDQNNNRADEETISDIVKEAESRLNSKQENVEKQPETIQNIETGNPNIPASSNDALKEEENSNESVDNVKDLDSAEWIPPDLDQVTDDKLLGGESEIEDNTDTNNVLSESSTEEEIQTEADDSSISNTKGTPGIIESNLKNYNILNKVKEENLLGATENTESTEEILKVESSEKDTNQKEEVSENMKDGKQSVTSTEFKETIQENPKVDGKTEENVINEKPESSIRYEEGKTLPIQDKKRALQIFLAAAELGNHNAMEDLIYPLIFGDDIKANISKSFEYLQSLAGNGNPKGQQGLGFLFGTGLHGNSSQAKAIIYTTFAALGGDTMAEMMLGYRHYNGIGVTKSCETALTYYKKVAKKVSAAASSYSGGNAVQRIRLYDELEQPGSNNGQIDEDLLQYYQFLADKGDTQAQVGLGQLYFQGGRGVDVNFERAFYYFEKATENGNGNAFAYLGKMYMQGLYVSKDSSKAHEYFTKSLESKNPIGQAGLGMLYLKGDGVLKDFDQALKYFSESAEQGWVEGQLQLGNMYYNGVGVKKDFRQAVKYFTFASQSGHVLAFYNLAMMHTIGAGVMRSCNAATELFKNVAERGKWSMMFMDAYDAYKRGDTRKALVKYYFLAELGYEIAQSNVAYILDKDEVSFFDKNETYSRALLQWSRAAEQGYSIARVKVGDYHFYGHGTKVNYEVAALQYRLASDKQANAQAMFNLGYMHEQGFGLKRDIYLAKRFYDMAAEASPDAQFPVYLALVKLAFEFSVEWLGKNHRFWEHIDSEKIQLYVVQRVGPDWDVYLITALSGLLGLLLLFRRHIRR